MLAIGKFISWLLGSTAGRLLIGAIAFFFWLQAHDAKIAARAKAECQTEQLKKTINEIARQRDAAQRAVDDAEKQAAVDAAEMAALERQKDATVSNLGEAKRLSCNVPDAAIRGLRNIK